MKNIWECEICGKKFYNEQECVEHETEHKKLEEDKAEKEVKKQESLENLNKLYNEFIDAIEKHREEFGSVYVRGNLFDPFDIWFGRRHRNGWY